MGLSSLAGFGTPVGIAAGGASPLSGLINPNTGIPDPNSIPNYYNQPMNSEISGMTAPGQITSADAGSAYQAKDYSNADLGYGQIQNQTTQKLNAQNDTSQDAIQRRFAAMGNLNSGAYTKAAQMQDNSSAQNVADADTNIGFQQTQARNAMNQQEQNKSFQSNEALQNRQFQGDETNVANNMKNQEFQVGSDLSYKNAEQQAADTNYDAEMNAYQAKHSGGLLGSGGFLGTGISL